MTNDLNIRIKINSDTKALEITQDGFEKLSNKAKKTSEDVDRFSSIVDETTNTVKKFAVAYISLNTAMSAGKYFVENADNLNRLDSRLKLATDSITEFSSQQKELLYIAKETHTPLKNITDLYIKMDPALERLGATTETTNQITENFAEGLKLGGANAVESSAAILQFAQAMGSGVLRGDEFNSMAEASPKLMEYMAKGLKVPQGELRNMAEAGELTAGRVSAALLTMSDEIERDFKQMPRVVGDAAVDFSTEASLIVQDIDKATGATAALADGIDSAAALISNKNGVLDEFTDTVMTAGVAVASIGIGLGVAKLAVAGYAATTAIATGGQLGFTAAIVAGTVATRAKTMAAIGLRLAMNAIPLVAIATGVALIASHFLTSARNANLLTSALGKTNEELKAMTNNQLIAQRSTIERGVQEKLVELQDAGLEVRRAKQGGADKKELEDVKAHYDDLAAEYKRLTNQRSSIDEAMNKSKNSGKTEENATKKENDQLKKQIELLIKNGAKVDKPTKGEKGKTQAEIDADEAKKIADLEQKIFDDRMNKGMKRFEEDIASKKKFDEEIFQLTASDYDKQIRLIDDKAKAYLDSGRTEVEVARLVSIEKGDILEQEYLKAMEQFEALDKETKSKVEAWDSYLNDSYKNTLDAQIALSESAFSWADGLNGVAASVATIGDKFSKLGTIELKAEKARLQAVEDLQKGVLLAGDDKEKLNKISLDYLAKEKKINEESFSQQIEGYANLAGAASAMFEQGSKEAQLAQAAQSGLAVVNAVAAVMNAGTNGDGYSAVARMLAAAATASTFLAQIGQSLSGGGGSSAVSVPANSGTVLGDAYAVSESTTNITDLLDSIHVSEYSELRDINRAVTSMAKGIESAATNIFRYGALDTSSIALNATDGWAKNYTDSLLSSAAKVGGWFPNNTVKESLMFGAQTANPLANLAAKLGLGSSKQSIVGNGLYFGEGTLSDKINQSTLNASSYANIQTKKTSWYGSKSTSTGTAYAELDEQTASSIALIYKSFNDTMLGINKGLDSNLTDAISNYQFESMSLELKGLTGDEVVQKLNDSFSAMGDKMASDVFGDLIDKYQELGEGLLETAVRVVTEKEVVIQNLGDIGKNVNGDILGISQSLVTLSGSLTDFQDNVSSYYDKYFSDEEKIARSEEKFLGLFTDLNITMPTTVETFRTIIDSLDLTTTSGQETFTTLMSSSSAFYEFATAVEESTKSATDSVLGTVTTFVSAFEELEKSTQNLIDSLTVPSDAVGKQDYLITQYHDLKNSFMSNFDSNGMADASTIDKMKADYGLLTSNISALSGAGINDMMKSALVTELGSFNSLFTKNEQAVKVEVVAGMLSVADQAKALGLTENQVKELQKSNGYSSAQVDTLYSMSTAQATNEMLGSVNEWIKSLYEVQTQARALDTASLSSSSFDAGHIFGTQEKIDFAKKTGPTIGSETFDQAIMDIQGFSTQANDIDYLRGLNNTAKSALTGLGSIAPGDAISAKESLVAAYNAELEAYNAQLDIKNNAYSAYLNGNVGPGIDDRDGKALSSDMLAINNGLRTLGMTEYASSSARFTYLPRGLEALIESERAKKLALYNSINPIVPTYQGFAVGTTYVPYDMTAQIHEGEIIIPETFSDGVRNGSLNVGSNKELIEEIRALRKQVEDQSRISITGNTTTKELYQLIDQLSSGGIALRTEAA